MEHNADRCIYPPIHVHVTLGNEDLTVKVPTFLIILKVILIIPPPPLSIIDSILLTLAGDLVPTIDSV